MRQTPLGTLQALIPTRELRALTGMPRSLIKCNACGLRPSQGGDQVHVLYRVTEAMAECQGFLCCRHLRAYTGRDCCPTFP